MGFLNKLLRREKSHEQWLEEHPGKGKMSAMDQTEATEAQQLATRERMEAEMAAKKLERENR